MPLKVFIVKMVLQRKRCFRFEKPELVELSSLRDFDADGDVDFIAGNHGLNSFHASPKNR